MATRNAHLPLLCNILPATITKNKLLDVIFLFKLKEPSTTLLFSEAALEEKPIMAIYTDAKVNGHSIKLILNNRSAGSIIIKQLMDQLGYQVNHAASTRIITTNGATKTSISKIDNFPIEVNSIMVLIKVLVIKATQYQALIGNDWLSKTNPEQLTHMRTSYEEEKKPTWEAYQVFWTNTEHNELLPSKKLIWKANQAWETDNDQEEQINWKWKEDKKGKRKGKEEKPTTDSNSTYNFYTTPYQSTYCYPKLAFVVAMMRNTLWQQNFTATHASLNTLEGQNKLENRTMNHAWLVEKLFWTKKYGMTFLGEKEPVKCLNRCPHNNNEIWQMALAKIEKVIPEDPEPVINLLDPEQFHEHYQDNCASESESIFNLNSNSNNDNNKNNGSSSTQNSNKNISNSNSDSNSEIYIALSNLSKEQELK
ncbi:hypothetical protein G9A89_000413 [Geosiphon pyriformis]|nr:hypothetical protein G9A89_000413 [Geosiphon pyriformis]